MPRAKRVACLSERLYLDHRGTTCSKYISLESIEVARGGSLYATGSGQNKPSACNIGTVAKVSAACVVALDRGSTTEQPMEQSAAKELKLAVVVLVAGYGQLPGNHNQCFEKMQVRTQAAARSSPCLRRRPAARPEANRVAEYG
ncbi:hypothetical protein CFAM422_002391 [Trichoderma lentiforme]|uniref:Uncharacterized protein n=1 Tax=Trichoderma lentiforme TaxID=1567552 RepID=A0A9P4XNT5_9HYPO|nr:hypothetical protein CFAM422_002391 [Trichoderma lentiforme]